MNRSQRQHESLTDGRVGCMAASTRPSLFVGMDTGAAGTDSNAVRACSWQGRPAVGRNMNRAVDAHTAKELAMCRFASAVINPKTLDVRVSDLTSHSNTLATLGLADSNKPNGWREMHYLPSGEVAVHCLEFDDGSLADCVAAVKSRWPTFVAFTSWAIPKCCDENGHYGGGLDLGGLTSAEGLTLPQSIGGYLYLDSLTSAEREAVLRN